METDIDNTDICDGATHFRLVKLEYTCAVNVVSDLASTLYHDKFKDIN